MSFRIDQLAVYNLATVGGSITAGSFVKSGGTSSQFLKADGSVDSSAYITGITSGMITTALGYTPVPTTRTLTINGTAYDLSADRSWTISAGVSSVSGSGAGISVSPTTGAVVVSNTGVTSNVAGTGISVSGATGAVTITNTGVTSVAAGTGISVSASTGGVTITNAGVTSVNGSTGAITGIITTSNYNSYSPTLTGGGASGTWSINITGSAGSASSVAWTGITSGYRTNYTLGFMPPDDSGSYAGFQFSKPGLSNDSGGYFLIRGGADNDVYTQYGITLVADAGWLTLAQRTQSNKGVRIMTGATATTRLSIDSSGNTTISGNQVYINPNTQFFGGYGSGSGPGISIENLSSFARFAFWGLDFYDWDHGIQMTLNGNYVYVNNYLQAGNSLRAPIFYDSDNTGYYLDPNSFSNLSTVRIQSLNSPNDDTVVAADSAMPAYKSSFIHTLGLGPGGNDGHILGMTWTNASIYGAQIWIDTDPNDMMAIRSRSSGGVWTSWKTVLHSGNYNSYSPTLTGGGASGTWSINISGTAASETLATVTGRGNVTSGSMAIGSGSIPTGRLYVNSSSALDVIAIQTTTTGAALVMADSTTPTWANAPRIVAVHNDFQIRTSATTRLTVAATGAVTVSEGLVVNTSLAWNNATPALNVGGTGDGRIQVRHIYGKSSGSAGVDHLWLQYQNTGNHVQIGDSGGGNNLYVSGNIYMGGYFTGNLVATQSWVSSQGYVTGGPYLPLSGGTVSGRTSFQVTQSGTSYSTMQLETYTSGTGVAGISFHRGGYTAVALYHDGDGLKLDGNKLLTAGNYNSYSPTLTGGGASGTWGISISGNAATASTSSQVTINYNNDSNSTYQMLWGSGNSVYGTAGVYVNPFSDYVYANSFNAGDWFRSSGASGWYNSTYAVGIYATDSTWVRTYNNAQFYSSTIIEAGGSVRAPIFYDSNDTSYYLDPNGTSVLATQVNWGQVYVANANYAFHARYTSGSDIYSATMSWYHLQLGNNGDNYIIAGRTATGGQLRFYVNNTSDFTSINGTLSAVMFASGRTTFGNASDYGYMLNVAGSFFATDWIRVNGTSGFYFESYGGGWHMTDSTYVRSYNGKSVHMNSANIDYVGSIYFNSGPATGYLLGNTGGSYGSLQINGAKNGWYGLNFESGNTLMMNSSESGHHQQGYGWKWRWYNGQLYVSRGTYGGSTEYTVWDSGNLTNLNQLSNGPGYITSSSSVVGLYSSGFGNGNFTWYQSPTPLSPYTGSWASYLVSNHGDGATYYNQTIVMPFWGIPEYFRKEGGTNKGPYQFFTSEHGSTFTYATNMNQYVRTTDGVTFGSVTSSGLIRVNGNTNLYLDFNYGCSIVGVYSSTRYQGVFAMGDAYKLAIDGTSTGSLYGLAWSHPNAGGVASNLNTHGLLVMENGTFLAAVSGSIRARDDMRAPIFYDSNNTSYYADFANSGVSIKTAGNVLIGQTYDPGNKLQVNGNIYAASDITAYSDIRVKTNIRSIERVVERIMNVRGVLYDRTDIESNNNIGFIAQELEEQFPELVHTNNDGTKGVKYQNMTAILVEVVKKQQKQIDELKARLN